MHRDFKSMQLRDEVLIENTAKKLTSSWNIGVRRGLGLGVRTLLDAIHTSYGDPFSFSNCAVVEINRKAYQHGSERR